jgi:hypothetical protein
MRHWGEGRPLIFSGSVGVQHDTETMTQPSRRHHAICQSSDFSHSGQEDQHSTIIDLLFGIFPAIGHLIRSRGKAAFDDSFYSSNDQVVI